MDSVGNFLIVAGVVIVIVGVIRFFMYDSFFTKTTPNRPQDMVSVGPLGYGKDGGSGRIGWPFYYVYCLGVAVLVAQITVYELLVPPPNLLTNDTRDTAPNYFWFCLSLFLFLAGLLNSYLVKKDTSFSDYPYLRYIVKVWLSVIFISPVILTIIFILKGVLSSADDTSNVFLAMVIAGNGFGMLGFALFGFAVHYINNRNWQKLKKRMTILITAEALTLVTAAVYAHNVTYHVNWLVLAAPYALVMGICVMFYKLEEPATPVVAGDDTAMVE